MKTIGIFLCITSAILLASAVLNTNFLVGCIGNILTVIGGGIIGLSIKEEK